jgi:hypothetical protein
MANGYFSNGGATLPPTIKVNITPQAIFDYEQCLAPCDREYPTWEEVLIEIGGDGAAKLVERLRGVGRIVSKAKKAVDRYHGSDITEIERREAELERARRVYYKIHREGTVKANGEGKCLYEKAFDRWDDIEDAPLRTLDQKTLKAETEEYITHLRKAERLPWWGYLRAKYYDDATDKTLMLFFYKGRLDPLDDIQWWDLRGIMDADDWSQELEDDGRIRDWIESEFYPKEKDVPKDYEDWAVRARTWRVLQNTNKTLYKNVLKEVKNAFECDGDKTASERMAFLQSIFFEIRERRKPD